MDDVLSPLEAIAKDGDTFVPPAVDGIPDNTEIVLQRQRFSMTTYVFVYEIIPYSLAPAELIQAMTAVQDKLPTLPESIIALSRPTTVQASAQKASESQGRALPMPSPAPGEWLHLCWEEGNRFYEQPCVAITGCDRTTGTWHLVPLGTPVMITQRQVIHVECDFRVLIKLPNKDGNLMNTDAVALDASEGGLRLRLPQPATQWTHLRKDTAVEVHFDADYGDGEVLPKHFSGEISHTTRERGDKRPDIVGIRFIDFPESERDEMRRYVFVQQMRIRRDKRYGGRR